MRSFRDMSLRSKQTLIITLTSSIVLLLACTAFVTYDSATFRKGLVGEVSVLAKVVGNNCAAAIDFNDPETAADTLAALHANGNIVSACVYSRAGEVFAVYQRDTNSAFVPPAMQAAGEKFTGEELHLFRPIEQGREIIGTIFVASDLKELSARLMRYLGIVVGVFMVSLLVALVLSGQAQRLVSDPILKLAQLARSVALEKNYSVRATKKGTDELGQLVDGFNEMLVQIQARDVELQKSKDVLEERVEERTRDLRISEERFSDAFEHAAIGMALVSLDGRWLKVNQALCDCLGYTAEELTGKTFQEITHPDDLADDLKNVNKLLAGEIRFYHMEKRYLHKQGHVVWVLLGVSLIRDGQGQPLHFISQIQDITERKQAEGALLRTEELYRRAIAGADAVPYSYDYKTKSYVFIGEGIEKLIGYTPQEVSGVLWKQIIQESVMAGETAGLDKTEAARRVATGEIRNWRCDMRVVMRDGKSRWISDVSVQNMDETGRATGSMGILQDITERKQAEISALAFSKLGKRLSSAASPKDAARIISEVSDELLGWDACWVQLYSEKEDLIHSVFNVDTTDGKRFNFALDDARQPSAMHRRILTSGAELILREQPTSILPDAVAFGNESRPSASIMLIPIRSSNRAVGILSIQSYTPKAYDEQDLTTLQTLADQCGGALERIWADESLRKSESQFRLVWDTSADGMRLADEDGVVCMINDAYCRMVEKSKEEIEGKPLSIIHRQEKQEHVLHNHREAMKAGISQSGIEKEVILWNGKKIWFEISNSRLELPGQPSLMLSIFRDITQRKHSETELEAAHSQLLDVSRQAGMAEVATGVLHNVGNVLNSVNVSATLIADSIKKSKATNLGKIAALLRENESNLSTFITSEKGKQLLVYINQLSEHITAEQAATLKETDSLRTNVEHIKEIVAMQQSYAKISGIKDVVKIVDLVEDSLQMNASGLGRHNVEILREFEDVPPLNIEKHKVLQILVNLIRNAKYACDESGRTDKKITVRIARANGYVCLSVIDNGIGIPPENLTRIFAHGFTTRKEGHGFGLHSSALAAKEMGGSISAHSDGSGKGAAFTLELPLPASTPTT